MEDKIVQIDQYSVLGQISEGTSGRVFRVQRDNNYYALKLLKNNQGVEFAVRFRKESATLARLNHENLVKIFNLGEYKGNPYLVMELVDGGSIESRLKQETTFSEAFALEIISGIIKGLHELQKYNLVHRDIKPANILLTKEDIPKIIDLGLVDDVDQIKNETALVGTPVYCSPEQSRVLKRSVDFRSDLYSIGIVLYELLTGSPPFTGDLTDILQKHASVVPKDVRELVPGIRAGTALIIRKLLAKDPDDRYQTAIGLLRDIERIPEIDRLISKNTDPGLGSHDSNVMSGSSAFVERTVEMTRLKDSWNALSGGGPGLVIVSGASGSGKTRLCTEFLSAQVGDEAASDFLILRGKCQLLDRDLPFGALREAIDSLVENVYLSSPEIRDRDVQRILEAAKGSESKLIQFSKSFTRIIKDKTKNQQGESNLEGEREVFLKDISNFFSRLSALWKGIVLFIDDLQWLDDSSLQLIETTFNYEMKNVFFMLSTARDDKESQVRLVKVKSRLAEKLKVEIAVLPFTKQQMTKLVGDFLGDHTIDPSIVDTLQKKADGSPFVAIEYLRAAVEQGFIKFSEGSWSISPAGIESLALSENVYSLILKRAERLSEKAKYLLQYAALWGGQFIAQDIAQISGIDSEELPSIMRSIEEFGLLERQGAHKWKFVHDKIQESMISALNEDLVTKMCDQLALFYEAKESKSNEEIFSLARIIVKGNISKNYKKAIQANINAGNLAIQNFAFSEAYLMFKLAYNLTKEHDKNRAFDHEISPKLATAATITGDWALAKECADLNIRLAATKEERQLSLMLKVWTLKNKGDYTGGFKYFELACQENGEPYPIYLFLKVFKTSVLWFSTSILEILMPILPFRKGRTDKKSEWLARRSELYLDGHWCAEFLGWKSDYIYIAFKLLYIGLTSRRPRELALGYAWIGHIYSSWGVGSLAKVYFEKADEVCEVLDDKFTIALCKQKKLDGLYNSGLVPILEEGHSNILSEHEKYLPPTQAGYANVWRVYNLNFRGLHKEALLVYEEGINAIKTGKTVLGDLFLVLWLAQNWFQLEALGKHKEAEKAKLAAMRINNKNRYNANASRASLNTELQVHRILEDTEGVEELVAAFLGGNNLYLFNQHSAAVATQTLYNILNLLEACNDPGKRLSLRSEFNRLIRFINWKTYQPITRSSIYLLLGRYYRIIAYPALAEYFYKKTEKLASKADAKRTLFELLRERARIKRLKGSRNLMMNDLSAAVSLAIDNNWIPTLNRLQREFGDFIESLISRSEEFNSFGTISQGAKTVAKSAGATQQFKKSRSDVNATTQKTMFNTRATSVGNSIDDVRFVDVLLEVTHSLVDSLDPTIQSKAVLTQIVKLFGAERGFIFIKNEKEKVMDIVAGKSATGEELTKLVGYSSTVINKVFETGKPVIVTGTDEGQALGSESAVLNNLRSIMATPLKIKEEILGVAYLDSSLTKGLFTQADIDIFSTLSNHISVGFELSRMAKVELEKADLKRALDIQVAIGAESRKVKILVDNMRQALFSIDDTGRIIEPVSKFSETVLGGEVVNKNLMEALYNQDSLLEGERAAVETVIQTVFGEDELQWSLMESNLPTKINFKQKKDIENRVLKIAPSPIWGENDHLERILFVVEDITAVEFLEKKVREQGEAVTIIEETLDKNPTELSNFLEQSSKTISDWLLRLKVFNTEDFNPFIRYIHTLKGNSRLFGLKLLAEEIHKTESTISSARENSSLADLTLNGILNIEKLLKDYKFTFNKVFRNKSDNMRPQETTTKSLNELKNYLSKLIEHLSLEDANQLKRAINRLSYRSCRDMTLQFNGMIAEISTQLQKKVNFEVLGDFLVEPDRLNKLQECLLHLIRNSIDHGIETPMTRQAAQKSEFGKLTINLEDHGEILKITILDDGAGINGEKVWSRAVSKGIVKSKPEVAPTKEEMIKVIFLPGFSSNDTVTDISGRGVGLDVVDMNVKALGGNVTVDTEIGKSTTFTITIPS